ncbi:hypothetical protein [uncultured Ruminococcus sp.]|uniref:hypothetical protein n=1 Tax=uncultured Ruminococcus sp. TaxID=165186 RepID=UPI0026671595|nr:hypothetical protein [uncultured Ruminococcus sp.]
MKKFFENKLNTVLTVILGVLILALLGHSVISALTPQTKKPAVSTSDTAYKSRINPNITKIATADTAASEPTEAAATKPTKPASTQATTVKPSTAPTTVKPTTAKASTVATTQAPTIQFATAIPAAEPADYNEQWNAGYLVAIDNPDKTYKSGQVTLSDHDRDLLERLCMGEFGSGGFVGASLIAQSVKDAMCFDGFTSVDAIIRDYHYTGSTDIPANDNCKQAVRYIFDENHDAVQHRILYMYNPLLVASEFHESQNYILTYEDVRFFDRWGY